MRKVFSDHHQHKKLVSVHFSRRQAGQAIAEGSVIFCLMVVILAVFAALMMFIGNYVHNMNQLTYVAQQAAIYGMNQMCYAGLPKPITVADAQNKTRQAMQPLLANIGLAGATVDFSVETHNAIQYGKATVTAHSVPMLGGGTSILGATLPGSVTISKTAMALETDSVPPFIADIAAFKTPNNVTGCVMVPCVAAGSPFNGGMPPAYFPGYLGVPGGSATGAPGYVHMTLDTTTDYCKVLRQPYSTGPDWAY